MKVIVRSAISECELNALPKTSIREIFDLMCKNLLIFEKWYFGLMYRGSDFEQIWVDGSKKVFTTSITYVITLNSDFTEPQRFQNSRGKIIL